jgi:nucleotide-binding universal stress UspA family protein
MLTLRSILCPVDFSTQSQHALRWAAALAVQHQSRLTVLTIVDPLLAHAAQARFGLDLGTTETEPALREFVTTVLPTSASWVPAPAIEVRVGDAAEAILDAADRHAADLIVMGTHGLGGFRKMLLGSTTERVLRRTHTPLLAVPTADQPVRLEPEGPQFNVKTILAATDFSETSLRAARWAADLAQQLGVPLVIAHIVARVAVPGRWQSTVDVAGEERVSEMRRRLERLFADFGAGVRYDVVVPVGRPAESIASTASEHGAGLIVMGLVGKHRALEPRPGSIAYRTLCLAHVPVLVVTPAPGAALNPPARPAVSEVL